MGLSSAMIKLIRINETDYVNASKIDALSITPECLKLYMANDAVLIIRAGSGYYKTARKALSV